MVQLLVHVLDEILSCSLQQKDLVVVVTMVGEVAALLADQLVVDDAESDVGLPVVLALRGRRLLRWCLVVPCLAAIVLGSMSCSLAMCSAVPIILRMILMPLGLLRFLVWALRRLMAGQ